MKLAHVLTAVNENPKYLRFIPLFINKWLQLFPDINITILFISDTLLPCEYSDYKQYIHHITPQSSINTTYIAQTIRILWPAMLNEVDGVIITDIDMIPGNVDYYIKPIEQYSNDSIISYRTKGIAGPDQIPICYTIANSATWSSIFGIKEEADVHAFLKKHYNPKYDGIHGGNGWFSDQELLFKYVSEWELISGHSIVYLNDSITAYNRLEHWFHKYNTITFMQMLHSNNFSDAHIYSYECQWHQHTIRQLSQKLAYHDYIFLIIDSDDMSVYNTNREIIRKYMTKYNKNTYYFIRNDNTMHTEFRVNEDALYLKGAECYIPGILQKTLNAFAFCEATYNYKYIVRTNISSFWNISNLNEIIHTIDRPSAVIGKYGGIQFLSGAGYILPKHYVQQVISNREMMDYGLIDDVAMGKLLTELHIQMKPLTRYDFIDDNTNGNLTYNSISQILANKHYHYRIKGEPSRINDTRVFNMLYNVIYCEHKSIIPSYTKDDIITTDGYFNAFVNNPHVHYLKMDTFYVSDFHWRNNGHREQGIRPIIITSHSDYPMTSSIYDGNNSRCKAWFSINVACAKENLYALPLGITNYNESGNIFKLYGNLDQVIEARNHVYIKTSLCYMNFAIINYIQERQGVWDMFANKSWIKCNTPSDTVDARMQYLTGIAQSKFTLCPRGNGVDTHRLWESLYLGSIPIVIDTVEHSQWKDLPILFINSWEEVTPAFLEAKWIEMIGKSWNLEKLKLSYWLKLIQENITKYESVAESS